MTNFTVRIPKEVDAELQKCRASIRESIRKKLQEIVDSLTTQPTLRGRATTSKAPPLRFYVFEGYRISYQVDPVIRSVVVTKLQTEIG